MAKAMHGYLVNFVKTGSPNGPGLPDWGAYDPAQRHVMDFALDGSARYGDDPWRERLDVVAATQHK